MRYRLKIFLDYIGSRRFAVLLLVITTSVILAGNLLPNPALMPAEKAERFVHDRPFLNQLSNLFHIMNITKSKFFLVIPAFIMLSITVCTARRVEKTVKKRARSAPLPPGLEVMYSREGREGDADLLSVLNNKGWVMERRGNGEELIFLGRKGEGGIWGSFIFHGGMVIVIIGALVSMHSIFYGELILTEGFPLIGKDLYKDFGSKASGFPYRGIQLDSFDVVYKEGTFPVKYDAVFKTVDQNAQVKKEYIGVNEPLIKAGYSFILNKFGYAPRFIIYDKDGKVIEDAFVNLLVTNIGATDQFYMPEIGVRVNCRFFPDFYKAENSLTTRTFELKNPVFILEFFKGGEKLGDGILPLNKRMDFDGGRYTIEFKDLKKWVNLSVASDSGLPVVQGGLLLIAVGLCIRFIMNEKRIWVVLRRGEENRISLGGKALYFPSLFGEEMKGIASELGFEAGSVLQ